MYFIHYIVKLEMLISYVLPSSCYTKKNSKIDPTVAVASIFAWLESSWLQCVGTIEEKMYKICITDLDELKQRLRTKCAKLDHVVIAAAIRQ